MQWSARLINPGRPLPPIALRSRSEDDEVEHKRVEVGRTSPFIIVQYPAVFRVEENVLLPASEGTVEDATVVDRYGDPDLMAEGGTVFNSK